MHPTPKHFVGAPLFLISCLVVAPLVAQPAINPAQSTPAANPSVKAAQAPLPAAERAPSNLAFELPRFKSRPTLGDVKPVAASKVTIDDLSPQGSPGAKTATKQSISYLSLDGGKDYNRPLRGTAKAITFVSFLLNASDGTSIDIGGAKLDVALSPNNAGCAQLFYEETTAQGTERHPLGEVMKLELHDKVSLAALPHLTVRLDPVAHVWDLYSFTRLVESDLPLRTLAGNEAKQFALHSGKDGAMVMSLISADENPLFVDFNANGIDDKFEKQQRLALLDADSTAADRTKLALLWRDQQAAHPDKPWAIRRPLPDGAPTAPPK